MGAAQSVRDSGPESNHSCLIWIPVGFRRTVEDFHGVFFIPWICEKYRERLPKISFRSSASCFRECPICVFRVSLEKVTSEVRKTYRSALRAVLGRSQKSGRYWPVLG